MAKKSKKYVEALNKIDRTRLYDATEALSLVAEVATAKLYNEGGLNDTKLNSLPSTGGMGTYLFTIIGVVVMAGAAGAFFISRRKGSEE